MNDCIFIESNEELGILYNRYSKIPSKISHFVDYIQKQMDRINKEGVEEANQYNDELIEKINQFKKDVEMDVKTPEPIVSDDIKETRKNIQDARNVTETQINRLGKLRHSAKWGNNWINGILFRSKILHHQTGEEIQTKTNAVARTITRALDWAEKISLDVLNLTSQDLNILTLVQKVYYRNIFENGELNFTLADEYDESTDIMDISLGWESSFTESDEDIEDDTDEYEDDDIDDEEDDDLMDEDGITTMSVGHDDEEYFPIYCVTMAIPTESDRYSAKLKKTKNNAKLIRAATLGETHSHATISFDPTLQQTYTFDADNQFKEEDLLHDDSTTIYVATDIHVAVTFLRKEEVDAVKAAIIDYNNNHDDTEYNMKQLVSQIFGKAQHLNHSQICSTFVGYLLNIANPKNIHRDYSMIRPEDVTLLPRSFHVINFKSQDDMKERIDEVAERTQEIYDANIDEIREYNNELPKVMIQHQMKERKFIDKIWNSITHMMNR